LDQTNHLSVVQPADGSGEILDSKPESGPVAADLRQRAFRHRSARSVQAASRGGFSADFDLIAGSVNPFDLKMFGNFKCPTKF
jgi:hypothetical protein